MCAWKQCRLRVLAEAQRADKKKVIVTSQEVVVFLKIER